MGLKRVLQHMEGAKETYISILKELVAQPSVSASGEGVETCARLLVKVMEKAGIPARIMPTAGQPAVFGQLESRKGNKGFTILFYGHYDVQPPAPEAAWDSPPFTPTIRDGRLYGRGTGDNKGQLLAHILAVRSYLETLGDIPVNVKFIFEGQEESGSPHIAAFVQDNRELLHCDLVYTSDGPLHESGAPMVYFGARGVLCLEIKLTIATHDNHSGNMGGVIANAALEMARLAVEMVDEEGRVTIPGFYDKVQPPQAFELDLLERLPFEPEKLAPTFGVEGITDNKVDFYRRLTLEPTLTINGLKSGYDGPGTKTIIPSEAVMKLDCRLVPDQDPREIFNLLSAYIKEKLPQAQITYQGGMLPSRTLADLSICREVAAAVNEAYGYQPIIMPACGGSLPDYVWTKLLIVPSVIVPYANADEQNHAPNENIKLDCFFNGIKTTITVLKRLGGHNEKG